MHNAPSIVFSHGQESGPWGTKITVMAEAARDHGLRVDSIDYRGIEAPEARVAKLVAACSELKPPTLLVGSSMGGYVSAALRRRLPALADCFCSPLLFSFLVFPSSNRRRSRRRLFTAGKTMWCRRKTASATLNSLLRRCTLWTVIIA